MKRASRLRGKGLRYWSDDLVNWENKKSASISEIENTDKTYKQFMSLEAPVEYWREKAAIHKRSEERAMSNLLVFFPSITIVMVLIFYSVGQFLLGFGDRAVPTAIYVVVSGGLATFGALAFWVGRLLTKLYLSEHHLRNDAEERAVMTTTFLALTHARGAEEADRHIVLTALFRATPDGIVKDEGPSDLSVAGLVGRLATRP